MIQNKPIEIREVLRELPYNTLREVQEYANLNQDSIIECSAGVFQEVVYREIEELQQEGL